MVGIVTDTVACLPEDIRIRLGIEVVPIHVIADGIEYRDGVDLEPEEAYALLEAATSCASAAPGVAEWYEAFERAAARGAETIVVVPVSRRLSSAFDSARLAASTTPIPVAVVDSGSATAAQGLLVRRVAERAAEGWAREALVDLVDTTRGRYHFLGAVAGLEPIARSGRIPGTLAHLGDWIDLKAVLEMSGDGLVHSRLLVRGLDQAIERVLADVVSRLPVGRPGRVVVTHARLPEQAEFVVARLAAALPTAEMTMVPFSPVMAVNTGPIIGIAWEDDLGG